MINRNVQVMIWCEMLPLPHILLMTLEPLLWAGMVRPVSSGPLKREREKKYLHAGERSRMIDDWLILDVIGSSSVHLYTEYDTCLWETEETETFDSSVAAAAAARRGGAWPRQRRD